VVKSEIMGAV